MDAELGMTSEITLVTLVAIRVVRYDSIGLTGVVEPPELYVTKDEFERNQRSNAGVREESQPELLVIRMFEIVTRAGNDNGPQ